ncbi:MAG: hypothetical protein WKF86_10600, partial [Acidimicrobiales bacterium]
CTAYDYACGDPINNTDPTGMWIDTVLDVLFIGYDLYRLANDGPDKLEENLEALGADIAGAATPGVTGLGAASRAGRAARRATSRADDGARFVVDSAGSTTLRAQGSSGWIDVSRHAAKRMTKRGISIDAVDQALTRQPFNYWHNSTWKVGYYDQTSNVFVGTVKGVATTVIRPSSGAQYIANLLAASP